MLQLSRPGEPAARSCYPAGVRLDSSSFCHRKAELTMGKDKYRLFVVDDESLIRENICTITEINHYGLKVHSLED